MRFIRNLTAGVLATGVAVTGLTVLTESAALASGCWTQKSPTVTGGSAHWDVTCANDKITVAGWVKDTKPDGKCAQVKSQINGTWYYSAKACPEGQQQNFSWTGPGSTSDTFLYVS